MQRILLILCIVLLYGINATAQESRLRLGVRLSGGYGLHDGLDKVLVSEDYYSNYGFKAEGCFVGSTELFLQYHKPQTLFGVEAGLTYYQKAASFHYTDIKELDYTLSMRHHLLGVSAYINIYPFKKGLYWALGGRAGANLAPRGLRYESNQEEAKFSFFGYGSVDETERLLREKLTGQADVSIGGGLGFEFPFGLVLSARYHYNLLNSIRTETNVFRWIEHPNHGPQIELNISYLFKLK